MINGFEIETAPLTDKEVEEMNLIVPHLEKKIGEHNAVTNQVITNGIKRVYGRKIGAPRLRKIINHIRVNNVIPRLVATSKGYYVEMDDDKLNKYIESLEQRISAIRAVATALKNQ